MKNEKGCFSDLELRKRDDDDDDGNWKGNERGRGLLVNFRVGKRGVRGANRKEYLKSLFK